MNKGGDTKIELGFSMTLAGAIPGIHPEGRRLGALRLGSRLETPKSQVWFLRITGELRPVMGLRHFTSAARGLWQIPADGKLRGSPQAPELQPPAKKFGAASPLRRQQRCFWELSTRSPLARGGAVRCVTLVDMVWRPYGRTSVRTLGR